MGRYVFRLPDIGEGVAPKRHALAIVAEAMGISPKKWPLSWM